MIEILPININMLIEGLLVFDLLLGILIILKAFLGWNEYRDSIFGDLLKFLAIGWIFVLFHTTAEIYYVFGYLNEFPITTATIGTSIGAVVIAYSFYHIFEKSS